MAAKVLIVPLYDGEVTRTGVQKQKDLVLTKTDDSTVNIKVGESYVHTISAGCKSLAQES